MVLLMAGRPFGGGRSSLFTAGGPFVIVLLLLLGLVGGCSGDDDRGPGPDRPGAGDAPFQAPSGVLLARPASPEEDNKTFQVFLDLVRHTPAQERIRILAHSFSFVPAAEELIAAHQRGVEVQVVVDRGVSGDWTAPSLLRDELGTDRRASSYIYFAPGDLHQKSWSFTRTGDSRNVVLVGSMNLTYQSGRQYTDVVSYVGRRDVRRAFDRRFLDVRRELPDVSPMGPVRLGRDRAWFFPGYDRESDPVLRQLAAVPAPGARIRVVMYAWLDARGLALAQLLGDKAAAGADVEVVLGRSVGPQIRAELEASEAKVRPGVFADGDDVHHKLTLVTHRGAPKVDGSTSPDVRFVLTGSDNFTYPSLGRPELLLRLDVSRGDPDARFARYDRWIDRLVARGRREAR